VHVVIVGAGEVGWYLAQRLGAENHDVVVVEQNEVIARALGDDLDVQTIVGNGATPSILREAGADRAELFAGVTQNDEVNLIAALLAKDMGSKQTVVRLENRELRGTAGQHLREAVGADLIIDPDADTAQEIIELVHVTGADEVYPMATGDVVVIGAVVGENSVLAGRDLAEIGPTREWPFIVGAVTKKGETVIPRGSVVVEAGDHLRVLTSHDAQAETLELLGVEQRKVSRVMVLGGGAVGFLVARQLQREGAEVTLVERDHRRAVALSERLRWITVVEGDITDTELLREESVAAMDVVIAATGEDTANVLACAYAAAESEAFTVAVLHRLALLPLVRQFGIDAALSPRTASANAVLQHMRGGTASVATFLESDVEVDEFVICPDCRADGARVADLHLPHTLLLAAVVRNDGSSEIVSGETKLHAGETIVVFARPSGFTEIQQAFT
jgi:trk system potassium uptake protein TrkA